MLATCRDEKGDTLSMISGQKSNSTFASDVLRNRRVGDRISPGSRRGVHPSPNTPGGYPSFNSSRSNVKVSLSFSTSSPRHLV